MSRLLLSLAALLAIGLAHADRSVTGRYDLRLSNDAARLGGSTVPQGRLTLHVGGRFLLEAQGAVRHGDYRVEGDRLILLPEDGDALRGTVDDERVTIEGVVFERPGVRRVEPVAVPMVAPIPTIKVAPVIVPPMPVVVPPAPVRPVAKVVPARPHFEVRDLFGAWTVWRNGEEQKDQRMELRRDGTFRFAMKGATSEGTWTLEDGVLVLRYVRADGQPLEDGASGRKEIPLADDGSAFQIDTFRYERATDSSRP